MSQQTMTQEEREQQDREDRLQWLIFRQMQQQVRRQVRYNARY